MKQISRILSIVALAFVGTMMSGCNSLEIPGQVGNDETPAGEDKTQRVTLTTTISLDGAPGSKALSADGVKTFVPGDRVAILYTSNSDYTFLLDYMLTADDIHNGGRSASLSYTLYNPKEGSSDVTFVYPAELACKDGNHINTSMLQNAQDGTLATLGAVFDAATVTQSMTVTGGMATMPDVFLMNNPLCICKFKIFDGSNGNKEITNKILRLTIRVGEKSYTVNRRPEAGYIYVAMSPVSNEYISISATDGLDYWAKDVAGAKSLAAKSIYPINITATKTNDRSIPFTIEATKNTPVSIRFPSETAGIQYSRDGGTTWTNYATGTPALLLPLIAGERLSFRGNIASYSGCSIYCEEDIYIYGNLMSLVTDYSTDENAFASNTSLGNDAFKRLFFNNTHIKSHPSKPLILPATSLGASCYEEMFYGCKELTTAPVLPATSLGPNCYDEMFSWCTKLVAAPSLPATTVKSGCYDGMFTECESLTVPPALPATKMETYCYASMFASCFNLVVAPALPATSLEYNCYDGMFQNCRSLVTAPVLPAEILTDMCYYHMFWDCVKLSRLTCLATGFTEEASDCTKDWLKGAGDPSYGRERGSSETRLFIAPDTAIWTTNSDSGIPTDWTRVMYEP